MQAEHTPNDHLRVTDCLYTNKSDPFSKLKENQKLTKEDNDAAPQILHVHVQPPAHFKFNFFFNSRLISHI
jgi:ABC-type transporter MlaC component